MMKDTKTFRCDGCDKVKTFDFYDESNTAQMDIVAKELAIGSLSRSPRAGRGRLTPSSRKPSGTRARRSA